MLYDFIGCFIGIWAAFAFPSQTAFQYVPLMQMNDSNFSRFAPIRLFTIMFLHLRSHRCYGDTLAFTVT